jgi:hypothetical protein
MQCIIGVSGLLGCLGVVGSEEPGTGGRPPPPEALLKEVHQIGEDRAQGESLLQHRHIVHLGESIVKFSPLRSG